MASRNSKAKQAGNAAVVKERKKERKTDRQTTETVPKMRGKKPRKQKKKKTTRSVRQRRGGLIDKRPQEIIKRYNGSGTQHQISSHCRRANNNNNNEQKRKQENRTRNTRAEKRKPHTLLPSTKPHFCFFTAVKNNFSSTGTQ
jgi:hypothetical protein